MRKCLLVDYNTIPWSPYLEPTLEMRQHFPAQPFVHQFSEKNYGLRFLRPPLVDIPCARAKKIPISPLGFLLSMTSSFVHAAASRQLSCPTANKSSYAPPLHLIAGVCVCVGI